MFQYHAVQWLFIFYLYCFLGWCFESAYVSVKDGHFINRGFLRGPFLPLYGSGAVMMFVVSMPFQQHVLLTYVAGCIGATALEYVTGIAMEALFNVRYWDYSDKKFNFQGRICLSSTIAWGFLTILMTRVIHRPIERFVLSIPDKTLRYLTWFLTIYIAVDFALSFKTALDLRNILIKMQRVKEELERMQKRLDVIIAFNNEDKELKRQERELKIDDLTEGLAQRFASLKDTIQNAPGSYVDSVKDEIADLRARYNVYMENRKNMDEMMDFYKRDMLRNNPDMSSGKFKDILESLKNMVMDKMSK
ncbi:MAG: hypothetical protein NC318_03835 [Blautia sp.]|nr:hypothetical protein [Lachnoclostridium sp.]MCM1210713.1 hypothetical protein [Blautia sp.]